MAEHDRHRNSASDDAESTAPEVPPVADALAELEEKVLVTDGGQPTDDRDPAENAHCVDDRVSGVEAALNLAKTLHDDRTEITGWEIVRDGDGKPVKQPASVDWPDAEQLTRDVAEQTVNAMWYAETESVPADETPDGESVYDDVTRYVVAIAGADRELVFAHNGHVETRDATPVPERADATDDDDQMTLAQPPSYADD